MRLSDTVMSLLYALGERMHRCLGISTIVLRSSLACIAMSYASHNVRICGFVNVRICGFVNVCICGFVNVRGIDLYAFTYATNRR